MPVRAILLRATLCRVGLLTLGSCLIFPPRKMCESKELTKRFFGGIFVGSLARHMRVMMPFSLDIVIVIVVVNIVIVIVVVNIGIAIVISKSISNIKSYFFFLFCRRVSFLFRTSLVGVVE